MYFFAGVTNQKTEQGTEKEQVFHIDGLYIPKDHDFISFDWDIALLHLEGRISFNPFVRPVCLPETPGPGENPGKAVKKQSINIFYCSILSFKLDGVFPKLDSL